MKSHKQITTCEKCKVELTNGRCLQCGTTYQDDPLEDRIKDAIQVPEKFTDSIKQIRQALDIFANTIEQILGDKNTQIKTGILNEANRLTYWMALELRRTGASFDLLTFTFYPDKDKEDFPLVITDRSGSQEENNFDCIEKFEEFLVAEAKYISGLIATLKILADK